MFKEISRFMNDFVRDDGTALYSHPNNPGVECRLGALKPRCSLLVDSDKDPENLNPTALLSLSEVAISLVAFSLLSICIYKNVYKKEDRSIVMNIKYISADEKGCEAIGKKLLDKWIKTLSSVDSDQMVDLYHSEAVLLPTLDATVRQGHDTIGQYFNTFLAKGPSCKVEKLKVQAYDEIVNVCGHYGFTFKDGSTANARFTFIFTKKNGEWKIMHHHSSLQPPVQ